MKFRTELIPEKFGWDIHHGMEGMAVGSCFAGNIALKLTEAKFRILSNPMGIMFNPASVADTIDILHNGRIFTGNDLVNWNGRWSCFSFHGSFSSEDPGAALDRMNAAVAEGARRLRNADYMIVTFGTSWVFELAGHTEESARHGSTANGIYRTGHTGTVPTGGIVANCHRFPAHYFNRRRMSAPEITERFDKLLDTVLRDKRVLFTVSPVRHLGDGLHGNNLSKAILLLAVESLVQRHDNAFYFPAFELLNDDLRDYRFYDTDLTHPSPAAIGYIWERFAQVFFSDRTAQLAAGAQRISASMGHRPADMNSNACREFRQSLLRQMELLEGSCRDIDYSMEKTNLLPDAD